MAFLPSRLPACTKLVVWWQSTGSHLVMQDKNLVIITQQMAAGAIDVWMPCSNASGRFILHAGDTTIYNTQAHWQPQRFRSHDAAVGGVRQTHSST